MSTSGTVTDYNSLKTYWKKEEEKEERFTRSSFYSASERASPHHPGGAGEGLVSLREYRMATRSPHTPAVGDREEDQSFSDPNSVSGPALHQICTPHSIRSVHCTLSDLYTTLCLICTLHSIRSVHHTPSDLYTTLCLICTPHSVRSVHYTPSDLYTTLCLICTLHSV